MTLDAERWARLQAIFHEVADAPPAQREAQLAAACGHDEDLKRTIRQMLEADATSRSIVDCDIEQVAGEMLPAGTDRRWSDAVYGPYRVVRPIGEGGMGLVLLGRRTDVDQVTAIKVLRDVWLSASGRKRFVREQRTLARLTHPSIAALYHADTLPDGTPWFAMEYVDGTSLTRYCDERVHTIAGRLRLFRAVCEAVQYAHQQLIVHRDLKPSNILVTAAGDVKLVDFGIARPLDSNEAAAERTGTGLRLMTPNYAAPEQVLGAEAGVQGDVYSLGVILYELLTGDRPFDLAGLSPREAEAVLLEREPARPSVQARVSGPGRWAGTARWDDLDVLCLAAMHKDPQRRYRSVEALVRDLEHYDKGEPLEARPPSPRYRATRFVQRHARALGAAALLAAAGGSLVTFYTWRLNQARSAAVAAVVRAERVQSFMLSLFEGGEADVAPSNDLRVISIIERGVQEARGLNAEPVVQAALLHTLGSLYQRLGSYDRADEILSRALEQRQQLLGADHPDTLESLVLMGLLRLDQSRADEAEGHIRDAVGRSRRLPAGHVMQARTLAALGKVLEERGAYDEATPVLERAAAIHAASGDQHADELAATLSTLANTHFYAGRMDASETLNRRVLEMHRRLRGERHPSVAGDFLNLGAIASNREQYPDATQYYRQAYEIFRAWYGDDHPQTASAMTILAQGLGYQGQLVEAAALLDRALVTQERVYGPVHRRVGFVLNEIGLVALRAKRLDDAEAAFARSLDVNRQLFPEAHFRVGVALVNLGNVHLAKAEFVEAERLYREALGVYADALPPEHPSVGMARIQLGRALAASERYADAEEALTSGMTILMKQSPAPASWIRTAREHLATVFEAQGRPVEAEAVRSALEAPKG